MKIIENLKTFGNLNESDLNSLEDELGISFPTDYKEFLSKTNGGCPKNNYLVLNVPSLKEELLINFFLGVNDDENFNIISWNNDFKIEMPISTFIFGVEYGGGMFIQITEGDDKGVYFWDSNFSLPVTSNDENVFYIADTFSDFLALVTIEK